MMASNTPSMGARIRRGIGDGVGDMARRVTRSTPF
jgi:hypothetical protein